MEPTTEFQDGISTLLAAAGEVHAHLNAPTADRVSQRQETSGVAEELRKMSETFTAHLSNISNKVDSLAERVDVVEKRPSPPSSSSFVTSGSENRRLSESPDTPWADRDPDERLVCDPDEILIWPDNEDLSVQGEQGCQLHRVSTATESLLKEAFSKTVPNGTRRRWREQYGMPATDYTRCPKLDTTIRSRLPKQCKDADRSLARIQALVQDAVGPLTHFLDKQPNEAGSEAVSLALKFLGNASAAISHERRRRAGAFFNEDLKPLIEEEDRFRQAAPCLFGKDFLSIAKDHTESVKALDKLSAPHRQSRAGGSQFFRTGRPFNQAARGGGAHRGGSSNYRGRGRYRPYAAGKDQRPHGRKNFQQQQ